VLLAARVGAEKATRLKLVAVPLAVVLESVVVIAGKLIIDPLAEGVIDILEPIHIFLATPKPPDVVSAPVMEELEAVVLVKFVEPATLRLVPTQRLLAIAIPPATVIAPPLVELVASVVKEIPIPPDSVSAPVVEEVEDVVLVKLEIPLTLRLVPIYTDLATAIPPAVVKVPPLV